MQLFSKEELINSMRNIAQRGWVPSVKRTRNTRNDGAVGNTLETLLGIEENNLPIPNAREWELKGQRLNTSALVTLKHKEPSPTACLVVTRMLCPLYGWPHRQAGGRYPASEKSFRSTTPANRFTNRGFKILVDRNQHKLRLIFDHRQADRANPEINRWLESVQDRTGLSSLDPEPYWGFADIKYALGEKLNNCFYVIADSKTENRHEYFRFIRLKVLSDFHFENYLNCLENGTAFIDFDARTGHNHGTKFRIKGSNFPDLYSRVQEIDLLS